MKLFFGAFWFFFAIFLGLETVQALDWVPIWVDVLFLIASTTCLILGVILGVILWIRNKIQSKRIVINRVIGADRWGGYDILNQDRHSGLRRR